MALSTEQPEAATDEPVAGLLACVRPAGRVVELDVLADPAIVTVRLHCQPDRRAAQALLDGPCAVRWQHIDLTGPTPECRVEARSARRAVDYRVGLATALGLAGIGVTTFVRTGTF